MYTYLRGKGVLLYSGITGFAVPMKAQGSTSEKSVHSPKNGHNLENRGVETPQLVSIVKVHRQKGRPEG